MVIQTTSATRGSRLRSRLASLAEAISGATECAAAARTGNRPSSSALKAVGIDPASWDRIGRR